MQLRIIFNVHTSYIVDTMTYVVLAAWNELALDTITNVAVCKFAHLRIVKDFSLFVAVEAEAGHDPQRTGK